MIGEPILHVPLTTLKERQGYGRCSGFEIPRWSREGIQNLSQRQSRVGTCPCDGDLGNAEEGAGWPKVPSTFSRSHRDTLSQAE